MMTGTLQVTLQLLLEFIAMIVSRRYSVVEASNYTNSRMMANSLLIRSTINKW